MNFSQVMQSQLIVTYTKDLTNLKYGSLSKWSLYNNFTVKYEWHCPEKDSHRKQEISFENLPLENQYQNRGSFTTFTFSQSKRLTIFHSGSAATPPF